MAALKVAALWGLFVPVRCFTTSPSESPRPTVSEHDHGRDRNVDRSRSQSRGSIVGSGIFKGTGVEFAYADAVHGATIEIVATSGPAKGGAFAFNLSQLCRSPVELFSERNTATATNATFYVSFCSTTPSPAERLIPRGACSTGGRWLNDFPSFAWQVERPGNDCYRLSDAAGWRATLIDAADPQAGLRLEASGGDNSWCGQARSITIDLRCDQAGLNRTQPRVVREPQYCRYHGTLYSAAGCPESRGFAGVPVDAEVAAGVERKVDGGTASSIDAVEEFAIFVDYPAPKTRPIYGNEPDNAGMVAADARITRLEALVGGIAARVDSLVEETPRTPSKVDDSRYHARDSAELAAAEGEVQRLRRQVDKLREQQRLLLQQLLQLALQQLADAPLAPLVGVGA